jgi:diadenosine tetraphosphatase ApaH/serine/threonine PP2A family protein phosphatase
MEMFDQIPLACLINKKFLCLHGGISYELKTVPLSSLSSMTSRRSTDIEKSRKMDFSVI